MPAPSSSRSASIESLEHRLLFSVPSGFENKLIVNIDTSTTPVMAFAPDGRLFVADTTHGQVLVVDVGAKSVVGTALTLKVDSYRERGINGLAFDPDYSSNRFVYIYYTVADPAHPNREGNDARNRLSRFQTKSGSPNVIDPASEKILLDGIPTPTGFHNGGMMHFGADGMLYLGVGEGGLGTPAQDLSSLNGKILRLNVSDPAHLVPSDNPFAGQSGKRGEIWAYGFRNPFSGNIKPGTNLLYVNDVGLDSWEEIDDVQKGKNYGWPNAEGNSSNSAFVNPIYTYPHNGTKAAIAGGVFYDGSQFPASFKGKYFFAEYIDRYIKVLDPATAKVSDFADNLTTLVDLDVGPDGSLFTLTSTGDIRRIRYLGSGANRAPDAVAAATTATSGVKPLVVKFSGSGSSDPDGDSLSYSWDFGDGASGSGKDVTHTYSTDGTFSAKLTVSDGHGGSDTAAPITVTVGNRAPTGTITLPLLGQVFRGGQMMSFAGTATDPEDGALPASAFTWSIVFHHADHTHPFLPEIPGVKSGTFDLPVDGEFDPDQFYRVSLTVTDSGGLTHTSFVDVHPKVTTILLNSNVPGIDVTLEGVPQTTPKEVVSVEGMVRTVAAQPSVLLGGKLYEFAGWSDGGDATHAVVTPQDTLVLTANYREAGDNLALAVQDINADGVGLPGSLDLDPNTSLFSVASAGYDIGGRADDFTYAFQALHGDGEIVARLADMQYTDISAKAGVMIRETTSVRSKQAGLFITPGNGMWVINRKGTAQGSGAALVAGGKLPRWMKIARAGDLVTYSTSRDGLAWTQLASSTIAMGPDVLVGLAVASRDQALRNTATFGDVTIVSQFPGTLSPVKASYVRGGASAGLNFGDDADLQVKRAASEGSTREAFLTFDLADTPLDSIAGATLRLFGRLSTSLGSNIRVSAYGVSDSSWSESGITYNNRPASGSSALDTVTVTDNVLRAYEFDVTDYVRAEKSAGRNLVTLALKSLDLSDPFILFNSDDAAANRPELTITG